MNHAPPATPRPRSLPSTGVCRWGCSLAASSISWLPMRWKRGPATCLLPSLDVFKRRSSMGSMSSRLASSSMTCSAAKAAAGEPGGRGRLPPSACSREHPRPPRGRWGCRMGRTWFCTRRATGGAGERAGFVCQVGFGGGDASAIGRAYLHGHAGGGGWAGADEDLLPAHDDLDGAAGFLGELGGERLEVQSALPFPSEAAADLHWDDFHSGDGNSEYAGGVVADGEVALAAAPDGYVAIACPVRGGGVRLDVSLMGLAECETRAL